MKEVTLSFDGYRSSDTIKFVPETSGVYCAYSYDKYIDTNEPIYIGQSINLYERIAQHESNADWPEYRDLPIAYSYAEVEESYLNSVENALIFHHQPKENDRLKDSYNHEPLRIKITGDAEGLDKEFVTR